MSPVLISRFGDREVTVRLEIWSTYSTLLRQSAVFAGGQRAKDTVGAKRKRMDEGMDVEESAYSLLQAEVPSLAKALLAQLKSPKTPPGTLQAGFDLMRTLLDVLPGCLSSQTPQIVAISKRLLSSPPTSSTATLHITCLQFLAVFFSTHLPPTFGPSLPTLEHELLRALGEKHPRVSSEAFRVFGSLLNTLKPVKSQDWSERVYTEALARLSNHDTDTEVRDCAESIIADLWICAPDVIKTKDGKEWEYICKSTGRMESAVKVVNKVAGDADIDIEWVKERTEWTLALLRRSTRAGKVDCFECLSTLIGRYGCLDSLLYPRN